MNSGPAGGECVCGLQSHTAHASLSSCSIWADSRSVYLLRPVMHLVEDRAERLFFETRNHLCHWHKSVYMMV